MRQFPLYFQFFVIKLGYYKTFTTMAERQHVGTGEVTGGIEQPHLQRIELMGYRTDGGTRKVYKMGELEGNEVEGKFHVHSLASQARLAKDTVEYMWDRLGIKPTVLERLKRTDFSRTNTDNYAVDFRFTFGDDPQDWPSDVALMRDAPQQEWTRGSIPSPVKPLSVYEVQYDSSILKITIRAGSDPIDRTEESRINPQDTEIQSLRQKLDEAQLRIQTLETEKQTLQGELAGAKTQITDIRQDIQSALEAPRGTFGGEKNLRLKISQLSEKLGGQNDQQSTKNPNRSEK
jgi:hypothetical protein